jgi:hypothetical protein
MTDLLGDLMPVVPIDAPSVPTQLRRMDLIPIPCVYCSEPIPAQSFVSLTPARRVLSAPCPNCDRRMTLAASTWRHWSNRTEVPDG